MKICVSWTLQGSSAAGQQVVAKLDELGKLLNLNKEDLRKKNKIGRFANQLAKQKQKLGWKTIKEDL